MLIKSNMRCIETSPRLHNCIKCLQIKSNMRCIETYIPGHSNWKFLIKSNMRCIETPIVESQKCKSFFDKE